MIPLPILQSAGETLQREQSLGGGQRRGWDVAFATFRSPRE